MTKCRLDKTDLIFLFVIVSLCLSVGWIVYLALATSHSSMKTIEHPHKVSLAYQRRDNVKKGIMCTPKSCCKLVDAIDAVQDNIEHEIEGKLDEDEFQCVPLSWTPQPPTMFTIP
jgi:hypothetical protein